MEPLLTDVRKAVDDPQSWDTQCAWEVLQEHLCSAFQDDFSQVPEPRLLLVDGDNISCPDKVEKVDKLDVVVECNFDRGPLRRAWLVCLQKLLFDREAFFYAR